MTSWILTEADLTFIRRDLIDFLPDRIFDAHAHLFSHDHYPAGQLPAGLENTPSRLGLAEYYRLIEWIHPNKRTKGGLFFGLAFQANRVANNQFVAAEVATPTLGENAFGQMIVSPDMSADYIYDTIQSQGFVGLKPYHTMALTAGPTWQAPITAYLPEHQVQVAHNLGLTITLHLVRDRALADPLNQAIIQKYCQKYPNMRLILAHAARGFNPWHTIEGISSLRGLNNVWFDTSAVTEVGAFEAIIETMGHERLLYGSDFYVSHLRGRCVAIGDSFHWIYADDLGIEENHATLQPVLIGLESLRSLKLACQRLNLTDAQIEALFYDNATQLFPITPSH